MPYKLSNLGPALAKGDVNGDGLEDFFVGGAKGQLGQLFLQQQNGQFTATNWNDNPNYEDVDALFFDADGDGDQDLYVVSGDTENPLGDPIYQDRLYNNDGKGNFSIAANDLPLISSSGSSVSAYDFDTDSHAIHAYTTNRVLT